MCGKINQSPTESDSHTEAINLVNGQEEGKTLCVREFLNYYVGSQPLSQRETKNSGNHFSLPEFTPWKGKATHGGFFLEKRLTQPDFPLFRRL